MGLVCWCAGVLVCWCAGVLPDSYRECWWLPSPWNDRNKLLFLSDLKLSYFEIHYTYNLDFPLLFNRFFTENTFEGFFNSCCCKRSYGCRL